MNENVPAKKKSKWFTNLVIFIICLGAGYYLISDKDDDNNNSDTLTNDDGIYADETVFTASDLIDLSNKLPDTITGEEIDVMFSYTGDQNDITLEGVGKMIAAHSVSLTDYSDGIWRVTASPYPGDKMVAAYISGDRSNLSSVESDALDKALEIVADARKEASGDMELELLLHDWLCDNVTYYDFDFSIEHTEYRPLTAVGALLDGSANCQGYTDGFYVLASLAGFKVDRQSVEDHIFNTIYLGNTWYIVDVTFNDQDALISTEADSEGYSYYRLFNAGRDYCPEHVWNIEWERNPISLTSDKYYYYNLSDLNVEHDYPKNFTDLNELAHSMIEQYVSYERKDHCLLLHGSEITMDDLSEAIGIAATDANVSFSYAYVTHPCAGNTFCFVRFD